MKTQHFLNRPSPPLIKFICTFIAICWMGTHLKAQVQSTKLRGKVIENSKGVSGAIIYFKTDDKIVNAVKADADGNYQLNDPVPGMFQVVVKNESGDEFVIGNYTIVSGRSEVQNWTTGYIGETATINPNIEFHVDEVVTGKTIGFPELTQIGLRNPIKTLEAVSSEISRDPRNGLSIRGSRAGASAYYVDGVKLISEPGLPMQSLGEVQLITGGIPAEYGDLTGGVIAIQTRNPGMYASKYAFAPKPKKEKKSKKPKSGANALMESEYVIAVAVKEL